MRNTCCIVLISLLLGSVGCSDSPLPFDRNKWANPGRCNTRHRMLASVTNMVSVNRTTKSEIIGLLGTNTLPLNMALNPDSAESLYKEHVRQFGLVYFLGEEAEGAEAEWFYLCFDFDQQGVCVNVELLKAGF